jgi:hypothetical protein
VIRTVSPRLSSCRNLAFRLWYFDCFSKWKIIRSTGEQTFYKAKSEVFAKDERTIQSVFKAWRYKH